MLVTLSLCYIISLDKRGEFLEVLLGFQTLGMTFECWEEMFKGGRHMWPKISTYVDEGTKDTVKHTQMGKKTLISMTIIKMK
jgi:hypothetical protein